MTKIFTLLPLLAVLTACSADLPAISGCEPIGDMKPVCGMKTPEDIAALPDGRHLLLSHFGGMNNGTGSLGLFDTRTESLTPLFPLETTFTRPAGSPWGDAQCEPPVLAKFSPHGTHLHQLADETWRYLVVNHGGRESIELFELAMSGGDSELHWRGCVLPAEETLMNDVVGLANGDLVFSRMLHSRGTIELVKSLIGFSSGDLWRWSQAGGLRLLPGTSASQPNGLEISADDKYIFANMYFEEEVWKVDASSGQTVATAPIAFADNSAWGSDGRLLVVTHNGGIAEMASCLQNQVEPCAASFEIFALDTETMAIESVFSHRGAPMGAATVAVPQAGRIYMGSFVGDRLVSVPDFSRPPD